MIPENGKIWYQPIWCMYAITQWLTDDIWILLSGPGPATHGGTCMMAMSDRDGSGKIFYTQVELQKRLEKDKWLPIKTKLEYEGGYDIGRRQTGE